MKVRRVTGGLGFDVNNWDAVLVKNPDAEPMEWELTWLDSPANDLKVIVGSGAVLAEGEYVYAFSTQERRGHAVYLVRWPAHDVYEGRLNSMEWWCGDRDWRAPSAADFRPAPVMNDAQTEFTVHRAGARGPYLQFQTVGFGPADVALRTADSLVGPWSEPATFYRPPERDIPRVMIYQGKAHPWLQGADLLATYCTNSFELGNVIADPGLYFPRFLRLSE